MSYLFSKILFLGLTALIGVLLNNTAFSQVDDISNICNEFKLHDSCIKTCVSACNKKKYLAENVDFCFQYSKIFSSNSTNKNVDDPSCSKYFEAKVSAEPKKVNSEELCTNIKKLSERLECEERGKRPSCSRNTPEIVNKAKLLVAEIGSELNQYGDLLTLDFTGIKNRDLLCAFSTDDLDEKYIVATNNPQILVGLQDRAAKIQSCSRDWEDYLEKSVDDTGSDILGDSVIRAIRGDLNVLRPEIEKLSNSVTILNNAAKKIEGITRLYINVCPAN